MNVFDPRLGELLAIQRGPVTPRDPRWRDIEDALGLALPASYKSLVDRFGASSWRDFLHVLSPFDDRLGLLQRGKTILDADRVTRKEFPWLYPLPLYPEPGGLLPWAVTNNGDTLYFITSGPTEEWPTLVKGPRAPEFEVKFTAPALLIHDFAGGSLRSVILPG